MSRLNESLWVRRLASELNLRPTQQPVSEILRYCERVVERHRSGYSDCDTPAALLPLLANKLGARIANMYSDLEIGELERQYVKRRETSFKVLTHELDDDNTFGMSFALEHPDEGELPYVCVVDCRGTKSQRRYHTAWHELSHLLILTDDARRTFRRSHSNYQPKSDEESLVDAIAGRLSFYPRMVLTQLVGEISFDSIEAVRNRMCPEASAYSSILNLVMLWPAPCIWLEAKLDHKKRDRPGPQVRFAFAPPPAAELRAVRSVTNQTGQDLGMTMIRHFRVPETSIIKTVFEGGSDTGQADEDLDMWTSSNGTNLTGRKVRVQARRIGDSVHALLQPR
jgi:hypothetical protein